MVVFLWGISAAVAGFGVAVLAFSQLYGGYGPKLLCLTVAAWLALTAGFFTFAFGIAFLIKAILGAALAGGTGSRRCVVATGLVIGGLITAVFGYAELSGVYRIPERSDQYTAAEGEGMSESLFIAWTVTAAGSVAVVVGMVLGMRALSRPPRDRRS